MDMDLFQVQSFGYVGDRDNDLEESFDEIPSLPLPEPETREVAVFEVEFLRLSDPDTALLNSVRVKNATHILTLCGPQPSSPNQVDLSTNSCSFELIRMRLTL